MNAPHCVTEPNILYFGTPVVLVSTLNENGTANLAPISSAFWLGWRGVIGIAASSQTTRNLLRTGECVLNLPSSAQADAVDRIARTTGTYPVPDGKRAKGYVFEPDKFGTAGLTEAASQTVTPPRALECPVHMERSSRPPTESATTRPTCAAASACSSCASSACTRIPTC